MAKDPHKLSVKREWDSTFQLMSWWEVDKVREAKVMVVGAGALGNEVLKNLALMNVGQLFIIDFDHIEYSNLSRSVLFRESDVGEKRLKAEVAAERVKEINPGIKTFSMQGDITIDVGLGLFSRMDVVIGCLDNRLARLYLNRYCYRVNKTWIDGAIENLAGQMAVYKPWVSCYESGLSEADWENIRFRIGCPDIAKRNASVGRIPTTPISSSIIAAMQVQEAIKVIHGNEAQSLAGKMFYYEGMNNLSVLFDTPPLKEGMLSHFTLPEWVEAPLSVDHTVAEVLDWVRSHFGDANPRIRLAHNIVLEMVAAQSGRTVSLAVAKPHLSDSVLREFQVSSDEELIITQETDTLDAQFPLQEKTLAELGIPFLQILKVEFDTLETQFFELSADQDKFVFS